MRPLSPTARARVCRLWPALLVGAAAGLLYASTAAPGLTWAHDGADGGDLITAVVTSGVPHPSGYPSYCLLGRLFIALVPGSMARRMNLFSAVLAAGSAALVYLSSAWLLARAPNAPRWRVCLLSAGAALTYATGPTLWSQATIAEVYALAVASFSLCLYLALRAGALPAAEQGGAGWWGALGLALGVGLGGHLTLLLALPGLAVLVWPARNRRRVLGLVGGLMLGLGVYLYLPLAAARGPLLNWGNPRTWDGFWWLVSGRFYHGYAFGLPVQHLLQRLMAWVALWGHEFAWLGLGVAALGVWSWWDGRLCRLAAATTLMVALYSVYAITYDTTDSYVYLLPAWAVTALWLAAGLAALCDAAPGAQVSRGWLALAVALSVGLPAWSAGSRYEAMNLCHDYEAQEWVDAALAALPPDALLITGQDGHTFAMEYACWVEGRCAGRFVVDGDLLGHAWYRDQLARRYSDLTVPPAGASLADWVNAQTYERRVFLGNRRPEIVPDDRAIASGPLWEIVAPR